MMPFRSFSKSYVLARQLVSIFLSALLIWTPFSVMANQASSTTDETTADMLEEVNRVATAAKQARAALDRSTFDPEALLESMDYESEQIIRFVSDKVTFQPYTGTLRGAEGTLMSKAGNALDQSILLAKLLKDAGYDARIARGELDHEQASILLSQSARAEPEPSVNMKQSVVKLLKASGHFDRLEPGLKEILSDTNQSQVVNQREMEILDETYAFLSRLLHSKGAFPAGVDKEILNSEARDYFWVQLREDESGGWKNIHPAIDWEPEIAVSEVMADSVPAELQHRFRFQVFIEQAAGGKLRSRPLMKPWERPTANLNTVPMTFANVAESFISNPSLLFDPQKAMGDSRWFMPALNGHLPSGGSYFDKRGNLIDPDAMQQSGTDLFQTLGEKLIGATETMDKGAVPLMTAQWIEFTLILPGGTERNFRRMTLDRIGDEARETGRLPASISSEVNDLMPLIQRQTFMLSNGAIPAEWIADFILQQLINNQPMFESMAKEIQDGTPSAEAMARAMKDVPNYWGGHPSLFNIFDQIVEQDTERVLYRSEPTLVVHRQGLNADGMVMEAIDIVQNPRRSMSLKDSELEFSAESVMKAGIWETTVEGSLLNPGGQQINTANYFADASSRGEPVHVVQTISDLDELSVSGNSRHAMVRDIQAGNVLVVANHTKDGNYGWWRINRVTGESVGQIADGRGSVMTEFKILLKYAAVITTVLGGAIGIAGCIENFKPDETGNRPKERMEAACCGVITWVLWVYGLYIGLAVSAIAYNFATIPAAEVCE